MKARIPFLFGANFILLLSMAGCKSEGASSPDPLFNKCWTHAFEEEGENNIRIFRPCATHTFPAARYRNTFTLNASGDVEYSVLAPNDAHTTEEGEWSYNSNTKKLVILNNTNGVVSEYEVLEIKEDVLKVKE